MSGTIETVEAKCTDCGEVKQCSGGICAECWKFYYNDFETVDGF